VAILNMYSVLSGSSSRPCCIASSPSSHISRWRCNPSYKSARQKRDTLQCKIGRNILGLSERASADAVFGELGWLSNAARNDLQALYFYARCLRAPKHGMIASFFEAVVAHASQNQATAFPFITHCHNTMRTLQLPLNILKSPMPSLKLTLKRAMLRVASRNWNQRLLTQPQLAGSYEINAQLRLQHYLKLPSFKGRQLLIKLRCDDLKLAAASFNRYQPQPCCPVCKLHTLETRAHFLLHCTGLESVRLLHRDALPQLNQRSEVPSNILMAQLLLRSSHANKINFIHAVGLYITDLWRARTAKLCLHMQSQRHRHDV
jgi:hypothetical protein